MKYKNFEELPIWQLSRELTNFIYELLKNTNDLQKDFRLRDQLQGASISIMNNIAEGFDAGNTVEFIRFLRYAQRSCSEIMSMTYILRDAYNLKVQSENIYSKTLEARKQIKGFINYLRTMKK